MNEIQKWEELSVATLDDEKKDIIRSVCKEATRTELAHFFMYCNRLKLDPFRKQIYFVKYKGSPPAIIIGIGGLRTIAARTKMLSGIHREPIYSDSGELTGAWAKVYRKDWEVPAYAQVLLSEYSTGKQKWASTPETMIQKVAECHALRMAFPDDLSDLYQAEEFDKPKHEMKEVESVTEDLNTKLKESMEPNEYDEDPTPCCHQHGTGAISTKEPCPEIADNN